MSKPPSVIPKVSLMQWFFRIVSILLIILATQFARQALVDYLRNAALNESKVVISDTISQLTAREWRIIPTLSIPKNIKVNQSFNLSVSLKIKGGFTTTPAERRQVENIENQIRSSQVQTTIALAGAQVAPSSDVALDLSEGATWSVLVPTTSKQSEGFIRVRLSEDVLSKIRETIFLNSKKEYIIPFKIEVGESISILTSLMTSLSGCSTIVTAIIGLITFRWAWKDREKKHYESNKPLVTLDHR